MNFCISGNKELDAILGACPLCGRPVKALELVVQEGPRETTSRIETACWSCQVTYSIEAISWPPENKYGSMVPAIDIWNKLSSQGKPQAAALNRIRDRHRKAQGVELNVLAEVLELLEE